MASSVLSTRIIEAFMDNAMAVLACAFQLLGLGVSDVAAPIAFVTTPPAHASPTAEAFVAGEPLTIYFVTSSPSFRDAAQPGWTAAHRAGCQRLAGILAHEEWHVRFGPDERGAYVAQLTALQAVGAAHDLLSLTRMSMATVIAHSEGVTQQATASLPARSRPRIVRPARVRGSRAAEPLIASDQEQLPPRLQSITPASREYLNTGLDIW
jgi:hypothetical protein